MVLVRPGNYRCGGTLVASKYVVTAAHCFFDGSQLMDPSDVKVSCQHVHHGYNHIINMEICSHLQVILGEHDLQTRCEGSLAEKRVGIAAIFTHEGYNASTSSNDIAVLELAEEVDLNIYTPACMAQV